jgi:hypothetical protein
MKRIIKLTESDLTRIVRRVLREQNEPMLPSQTLPDQQQKMVEFTQRMEGQKLNFYLIGDSTQPVISQFKVSSVRWGKDKNEIYIYGSVSEDRRATPAGIVAALLFGRSKNDSSKLTYRCQEKDVFILDNLNFGTGWGKIIEKFVDAKMEFANVSERDKNRVRNKMVKDLITKNPAPLVQPGINEETGKTFLDDIKNILCSTNIICRINSNAISSYIRGCDYVCC